MTLAPVAFGLAAALATLAGGALALRLRHRLGPVLGAGAGVVLGVALCDLLPEALALARGDRDRLVAAAVAAGFGLYLALDRLFGRARWLPAGWRTHLGPATLTLHSLLDGAGIGVAFRIDTAAGWLVALAVLAHDLADGVNTVGLCLAARSAAAARRWLALNGAAPLLGVLLGLGVAVPPAVLAPLVAAFAGMFLYIGACGLLPRARALDPSWRTIAAGLAGLLLMFVVTRLAR